MEILRDNREHTASDIKVTIRKKYPDMDITEGVFSNSFRTLTLAGKCINKERGVYVLNSDKRNVDPDAAQKDEGEKENKCCNAYLKLHQDVSELLVKWRKEFMTLQQLRYITMVAEKGTISEAAKELFISQPSLTNAIRELEQEMQVTIFHRTNKGVTITAEGDEFLAYARQILDQVGLMQERYLNVNERNPRFSVSCQHYSFAVNAFVDVIRKFDARKYDFTLRETQTYEIIEDVAKLKSEIGILYTSSQNETIIMKLIRQNDLKFEELFVAKPHVFISSKHPLADKEALTLEDLEEYPYLSFEQGDYNSFYFSEEILSTLDRNKNIKVRDRATLFNLAVGLDGYTVSSGVISKELNGENIIGKPLLVDEYMRIGTIVRKDVALSRYGKVYMEALKKYTGGM